MDLNDEWLAYLEESDGVLTEYQSEIERELYIGHEDLEVAIGRIANANKRLTLALGQMEDIRNRMGANDNGVETLLLAEELKEWHEKYAAGIRARGAALSMAGKARAHIGKWMRKLRMEYGMEEK